MAIPDTSFGRAMEKTYFKESTYEIISKVAYMIGVPKRIFENENESPQLDIYKRLEYNKAARIIRNLCILRTGILRNFKQINDKITREYRSILSVPEYLPTECFTQLNADGVNFIKKSSTFLAHHIIEINRILSDRINNCKDLFPLWLKWEYIRDMFIMPDGLTVAGTKSASEIYYESRQFYPYQMYINWHPTESGNILNSDKKFALTLYEWHNDYFTDTSNVQDAGNTVKSNIYDFLDQSYKIVVAVDCENSDPYRLYATLKNLDYTYTQKIFKIILFDDIHTASAWRILDSFTDIPIEHIMIERLKHNKSLVDITLTARACKEHYTQNVDSFIIVSSDSDYWGLISSMPSAKFLVMVEREKCGPDMKEALSNTGIFFCYIDDFNTGNAEEIKMSALFKELYRYLDNSIHLNVNDMFDEALRATRINMTPAERNQFYDKHIRQMSLVIDDTGNVSIELHKK